MTVFREQQGFPTRNYPYHRGATEQASPPDAVGMVLQPNTLYRRVVGLDPEARPMTPDELLELDDPFGRFVRSGRPFPLSLRQLLEAIDALAGTPDALPDQLVFLAADGGHIPWTSETDRLGRLFRFAIARGSGEFPLLISTSTAIDSPVNDAFLQVLGWDATHEVFQYYERLDGTFFWAGMSYHALADATRGKGPFDSHVNGSMVMKELRAPWVHWHAPLAGINADALAPDDPLRDEPLFTSRVTADRLEMEVVRPGIQRWNAARVGKAVGADGVWRNVRHFLRQAVTDTTINLATSDIASHVLADDDLLHPPLSFFVNRDTLFDTLGIELDDLHATEIAISGRLYRELLRRYDVHRTDGYRRIEGDAHFAFLVPEPAFEDTHLVEEMVGAGLLTRRFAACLAMTDFSNPVFSRRRAALLRYVPEQVGGPQPGEILAEQFVAALRAAVEEGRTGADEAGSPEQEFLGNWDQQDHDAVFLRRINDYFLALREGMTNPDVVDGWFRLVEYRRRRFRRRPLAEFSLTTPRTNIPRNAPALRMTEQGRVEVID